MIGTIVINKSSITYALIMVMGVVWFYLLCDYLLNPEEDE